MLGENFGVKKVQTINRRMFIIGAAKLVVFTGIITRLFSLQINENKKYLTLSDKNRIREWKLPPTRGNIVDYFGNIIKRGKRGKQAGEAKPCRQRKLVLRHALGMAQSLQIAAQNVQAHSWSPSARNVNILSIIVFL